MGYAPKTIITSKKKGRTDHYAMIVRPFIFYSIFLTMMAVPIPPPMQSDANPNRS